MSGQYGKKSVNIKFNQTHSLLFVYVQLNMRLGSYHKTHHVAGCLQSSHLYSESLLLKVLLLLPL